MFDSDWAKLVVVRDPLVVLSKLGQDSGGGGKTSLKATPTKMKDALSIHVPTLVSFVKGVGAQMRKNNNVSNKTIG